MVLNIHILLLKKKVKKNTATVLWNPSPSTEWFWRVDRWPVPTELVWSGQSQWIEFYENLVVHTHYSSHKLDAGALSLPLVLWYEWWCVFLATTAHTRQWCEHSASAMLVPIMGMPYLNLYSTREWWAGLHCICPERPESDDWVEVSSASHSDSLVTFNTPVLSSRLQQTSCHEQPVCQWTASGPVVWVAV